jgi:hypothetical protein
MATRLLSFRHIEAEYEAAGAKIAKSVSNAVRSFETGLQPRFLNRVYSPSAVHVALAKAAELLRKDPERKLVSAPIQPSQQISHDESSKVFVDIANATVGYHSRGSAYLPLDTPATAGIDACSLAETRFARTILQLREWAAGEDNITRGSQIITAFGKPVMLRKSFGANSTLALVGVKINDIPYPAGSILNVMLDDGGEAKVRRGLGQAVPEKEITAHDVSEVSQAGFRRLSAFALRRNHRPLLYPLNSRNTGSEVVDALYDLSVQSIRNIAKRALVRCQQS